MSKMMMAPVPVNNSAHFGWIQNLFMAKMIFGTGVHAPGPY